MGVGRSDRSLLKNTWSTMLSGSTPSECGHVGNVPHEIQQADKHANHALLDLRHVGWTPKSDSDARTRASMYELGK